MRLSPTPDGGTYVELEHVAHVDDERWGEFGPGAVGVGWGLGILGLATHLATGDAVAQGEGEQFAASDEGRRFMTPSSDHWYEAAAAGGEDAAAARAAADRTTAAYVPPQD